ncbi:MAG: type I restriction-modification system subunit M N-terminal domain-containing protein, partial [bacterium]|nr:type I restriction-modification system subunit M N-terminal domain-containing protein [bacterium]
MTRESLANDLWRACDIMRRDDNCGGVMEYVEHLSWLLFLCFLDAQEKIFEQEAALAERTYTRVLDEKFRWSKWARKDWPSDDLLPFIRGKLLPYLQNLRGSEQRDIIRGIFADRPVVVMASPYNLKDVLEIIDDIDFQSQDDIHTVSFVYEDLLRRLGSE